MFQCQTPWSQKNDLAKLSKQLPKRYLLNRVKASGLTAALLFTLLFSFIAQAQSPSVESLAKASFVELRLLAEQNQSDAQYTLAQLYEIGANGVKKDLQQAIDYYRMAAAQQHRFAQFNLGRIYLKGPTNVIDTEEAIFWLKKSAWAHHPEAPLLLARHYAGLAEKNTAVSQEAIFWYQFNPTRLTLEDQKKLQDLLTNISPAQKILINARLKQTNVQQDIIAAKSSSESAIKVAIAQNRSNGTAFFVNSQGFALTSLHVVNQCESITGEVGQAHFAFALIAANKEADLALIHSQDANAIPIPFGAADLIIGEELASIGYPFSGLISATSTISNGIVNARLTPQSPITHRFQFSAPIQPGNSGGPLLNRKGELIGMSAAILSGENNWLDSRVIPQNVNFGLHTQSLIHFLREQQVSFVQEVSTNNTGSLSFSEIYRLRAPSILRISCKRQSIG